MSYATVENVKSLFRDFWSGSNPAVTDPEIQDFLDDSNAIINAKLGTLYSGLPVTVIDNPESFKIVKRLESFMAACVIDDILNSYGEADKKPMWCKKSEDLLNELVPPMNPKTCEQCPPTMILPDLPYLGTQKQRGRIKLSATSGRVFTKGGSNW